MKEGPVELHEHAEHGHSHPELAPLSVTMAILAVLVTAIALLGHGAHSEEILLQTKASDQWAYYQAKNIRGHTYELFLDLLSTTDEKNNPRAVEVRQKYEYELQRYAKQKIEIETDARKFEQGSESQRRRANRFDPGEGILEAALAITSLTILTRRRLFW